MLSVGVRAVVDSMGRVSYSPGVLARLQRERVAEAEEIVAQAAVDQAAAEELLVELVG